VAAREPEPRAHPDRLRGEGRFEEVAPDLGGYSTPGVPDLDHHTIATLRPRRDPDLVLGRTVFGDGLGVRQDWRDLAVVLQDGGEHCCVGRERTRGRSARGASAVAGTRWSGVSARQVRDAGNAAAPPPGAGCSPCALVSCLGGATAFDAPPPSLVTSGAWSATSWSVLDPRDRESRHHPGAIHHPTTAEDETGSVTMVPRGARESASPTTWGNAEVRQFPVGGVSRGRLVEQRPGRQRHLQQPTEHEHQHARHGAR
jgi:hypothetical protein